MSEKKIQTWFAWRSKESVERFIKTADPKIHTIIFCQEEWEINFTFKYRSLKRFRSVDIIFGTYDKEFHNRTTAVSLFPSVRVHVWPDYFLYFAFRHYGKEFELESKEPDALFTCMNHQAHDHRMMMIDMLAKHDLLRDNYFSWLSSELDTKYELRYWKASVTKLDDGYKLNQFPEQMSRSVFDLVTESQAEVPFITEKTYNAILHKKPFIVQGCPGIHAELERQGFKLPREVVDYSFDSEPDTLKRAEMIATELKRLSEFNLSELQESLKETAEFNRQKMIAIARRQEGIPSVMENDNYFKHFLEDVKCRLDSLESEN